MAHSAVGLIPIAHYVPMNRLLAMIAGEDVLASTNLSRFCNATGQMPEDADPVDHGTHVLGAWAEVDSDWLVVHQNLSTALPAPEGGWPLMVDGEAVLTEAEAQAAVGAFTLNVTSRGEWAPAMIQSNLDTVLQTYGLALLG